MTSLGTEDEHRYERLYSTAQAQSCTSCAVVVLRARCVLTAVTFLSQLRAGSPAMANGKICTAFRYLRRGVLRRDRVAHGKSLHQLPEPGVRAH